MMNYDENDQFQEFRNYCLKFAKVAEKTIIEEWLEKIGYNEPVGYYCSLSDRVMTIYTTRPGVLIGKSGANINRFKSILTREFGGEWKVTIEEVRGGFVNNRKELNDLLDNMISAVEGWQQNSDVVSCKTVLDMLKFSRKEYLDESSNKS